MSRDRSRQKALSACGGCGDRRRRGSGRSIEKMSKGDKVFFDTNVLLYAIGQHDLRTPTAEALLASGGTISVQVLNELASVARRKLQMAWPDVIDALGAIRSCVRRRSLSPREYTPRCGLPGSTALTSTRLIVAAALDADCARCIRRISSQVR